MTPLIPTPTNSSHPLRQRHILVARKFESKFPHFLMTSSVCSWMICWMSRCKATSPSEHRDSSTEASEHRDSVTKASELLRNISMHVSSVWVRVSLPTREVFVAAEVIRWEGGTCEEYLECGWVWYCAKVRGIVGWGGLGCHLKTSLCLGLLWSMGFGFGTWPTEGTGFVWAYYS